MKKKVKLMLGDCIEKMKELEANSIDCIATDPPYGIEFMGKCYSDDTEILTISGWMLIKNIVEKQLDPIIYTLNPSNHIIEFSKISSRQKYKYNDKMIRLKGRSIDLLITPNHNIYYNTLKQYNKRKGNWIFKKARDLPKNIGLITQGKYIGINTEVIRIENKIFPLKPFIKFIGIFLGDGFTVNRKKHKHKGDFFGIASQKDQTKKQIQKVLNELGIQYSNHKRGFHSYDKVLLKYLKQFGRSHDKFIPKELWKYSEKLLSLLFDGLMLTDGHVSENVIQYYTSSKLLADDIQRLCLLIGRSCTIGSRIGKKETIICNHKTSTTKSYVLSIHKKNKIFYLCEKNLNLINYNGFVYDITVEKNHLIYVRRNGRAVWCSNSWDKNFYKRADEFKKIKSKNNQELTMSKYLGKGLTEYKGGLEFQSWCTEWGKEAIRVLKPGAVMFTFGHTRTYHRMVCGLEDAGFKIIDMLEWVYWCISEDTEILTREGFKGMNEVCYEDKIATFNINTDEIEYQKVLGINIKDYNGKMLSIKNKLIDQLITPNHKILYRHKERKRQGNKRFNTKWKYIKAKNFKHFSGLQFPLSGRFKTKKKHIENEICELIGWILTDGHFYNGKRSKDIRIYQSSTNKHKVNRIRFLLEKSNIPFKEYKRERTYKKRKYIEHVFYISGFWNKKIRNIIPNKKPTDELLFLSQDNLLSLFKGLIGGDGSIQGRNKTNFSFYQKNKDTRNWFRRLCVHLGYKTVENNKKYVIQVSTKNHIGMQSRFFKNYVKWVDFKGKVWCINTPNKNFVAKRNGRIFITGNSGFPKAYDVSKGYDRKECRKQLKEKLGRTPTKEEFKTYWKNWRKIIGKRYRHGGGLNEKYMGMTKNPEVIEIEPKTELGKKWKGWKNARGLKPAHEPILLAQKALEKGICDNFKKWSVGGINIQANLIPYGNETDRRVGTDEPNRSKTFHAGIPLNHNTKPNKQIQMYKDDGRFPSNMISSAEKILGENTRMINLNSWGRKRFGLKFWKFIDIPKPSMKEKNKGIIKSNNDKKVVTYGIDRMNTQNKQKNRHPTVKPINIFLYLLSLGCPQDGIVLDPFMGSGTSIIASIMLHLKAIGIEKHEEYYNIAKQRIKYKLKRYQRGLGEFL